MDRRKPVVKLVGVSDATAPAAEGAGQSAAEGEDSAASKLQAAARGRQVRRQQKREAESKAHGPIRAILLRTKPSILTLIRAPALCGGCNRCVSNSSASAWSQRPEAGQRTDSGRTQRGEQDRAIQARGQSAARPACQKIRLRRRKGRARTESGQRRLRGRSKCAAGFGA